MHLQDRTPRIVKTDKYVIIGSVDHGMSVPGVYVPEIINSLTGISALIAEGDGNNKDDHAMSPEVLCKASVSPKPIHFLPESDSHTIDFYLRKQGMPPGIFEAYLIANFTEFLLDNTPDQKFSANAFAQYANKMYPTIESSKVKNFIIERPEVDNDLFSIFYEDMKYFIDRVREHQFWKPELEKLTKEISGKIGFSVGAAHIPTIVNFMEGRGILSPPTYDENKNSSDNGSVAKAYESVEHLFSKL